MRCNCLRISPCLQQATASRFRLSFRRHSLALQYYRAHSTRKAIPSPWISSRRFLVAPAVRSVQVQEGLPQLDTTDSGRNHDEDIFTRINQSISEFLDTKDDQAGDEILLGLCNLIVGNNADADIGTRLLTRLALEKPSTFHILVSSIVRKKSRQMDEQPRMDLTSGISWPSLPLSSLSLRLDENKKPGRLPTLEQVGVAEEDGPDRPQTISEAIEGVLPTRSKLDPVVSKAVGYIFRALGSMIIDTSPETSNTQSKVISQVMVALAIFHENGIISDSVYKFVPTSDKTLLKQPPTLHLLSNTIMSILANVAFEVRMTQEQKQPLKDLLAIHRFSTQQLGPEVWLELVLWSCLHGEWLEDGAAVLKQLCESNEWSLICWKDVESASEAPVSSLTPTEWYHLRSLIGARDVDTDPDGKRVVERTVTSELISAYVDALVCKAEGALFSGSAAISPALDHLERLQELLDRQSMGLGYTTWDAICLQLSDAQEFGPLLGPKLMLRILRLVKPYGQEASSVNLEDEASRGTSASNTSYIYDASAAILGLLHRVIDVYCREGNVDGALRGLEAVQVYTDLNKRRSLAAFFEELKEKTSLRDGGNLQGPRFISDLSAADYPSYFPQIPTTTLSSLLDLVSSARLFDLGDWMLDSQDIDGPLIGRNLFSDPTLAPAIIRYATASSNQGLLSEVLNAQTKPGWKMIDQKAAGKVISVQKGKRPQNIQESREVFSPQIFQALLDSQIENQLWPAAENVLQLVKGNPDMRWHYRSLVLVGKQLLLLQSGITPDGVPPLPESLPNATRIFRSLLLDAYGPGTDAALQTETTAKNMRYVRITIAGIFASINPDWANFILPFQLLREKSSTPLWPELTYFNVILEGICRTAGLEAGQRFWHTWCSDLPVSSPNPENYFDDNRRVVLDLGDQRDGKRHQFVFQSKFVPNLSSVRIMLRQVLEDRGSFDLPVSRSDVEESRLDGILRWMLEQLDVLVESADDRQKELQRLLDARDRQIATVADQARSA